MTELFSQDALLIVVRLIVSHLIADFILQPDHWIQNRSEKKIKSLYLYLHGLVVGVVTYFFLGDWDHFGLPAFVMGTHIVIDAWKSYRKDTTTYFLIDQALHTIMIFIAWLLYIGSGSAIGDVFLRIYNDFRTWNLVMAYIFIIWPTGYFVSKATAHWRKEIDEIDSGDLAGLSYAGKWIGRIERVLILTFVIFNHYEAIGFLIAAKSIFRVNGIKEKHDRKEVEYILIGTLLSFAIAIVTGLIIRVILDL